MSIESIIRAWKDAAYRESLSEAERALLPEHPAGFIELTEVDLSAASGVGNTIDNPTGSCCDHDGPTDDCDPNQQTP